MSRSYIKHPCIKICGRSDKLARSYANRKLRRVLKTRLKVGNYQLVLLREVSDTWSFPSDGLAHYMHKLDSKYLRKNKMPDTEYTIHYTPEKTCKWCKKDYRNLYYCDLNARHRNLGRCKICLFGHYK